MGNFDGVHRGHRQLVLRLRDLGRELAAPAIILTFDPHPLAVLAPDRFEPLLTTTGEKARLLHQAGADQVLVLKTEPSLLALSYDRFFAEVLCQRLGMRGIVEGPNFRFGKDCQGDVARLRQLCQEHGLPCVIVEPTCLDGQMVSSSKVRQALQRGDVSQAWHWLGRPYAIEGVVVSGQRRGRTLGFPTANLSQVTTLRPAAGVYAVRAGIGTPEPKLVCPAAANLGPNPTFADGENKIEVHLLDYDGDLLGQMVRVEFLERIRDVRRFASAEELRQQIAKDVEAVRRVWAHHGPAVAGEPR